jgi:hypothetical protein
MRLQLKTRGFDLTDGEEAEIRQRVDRLEKRLAAYDPEVIDLEIELEKQARRREFTGDVRLVIMSHVLPVRRNRAPGVRPLLGLLFDDIDDQLERLSSGQRHDRDWKRKRGARETQAMSDATRALTEERALLDQALVGDRTAFDRLAESRLAGVRTVIFEALSKGGREPTNDSLDQALTLTMSRAFERLHEKPEDWTIHGWLAQVAREELQRSVRS